MKNVTVSLDDETYRQARRRAAQVDRSLSSVVREFLQQFGAEESTFDRLAREERELREQIGDFSGADRLSRDALHERGLR